MPLDTEVIAATNRGSFRERMPFPEVARRLLGAGVERYYADLRAARF